MQFTKSMIDLVSQIRKAAPTSVRPRIKLTAPDLFETLGDLYRMVDDEPLKAMIRELMSISGTGAPELNVAPKTQPDEPEIPTLPVNQRVNLEDEPRTKVMMYRGQRMIVPA